VKDRRPVGADSGGHRCQGGTKQPAADAKIGGLAVEVSFFAGLSAGLAS